MADQVNVPAWTHMNFLIDSRQESEALRARRCPWVALSIVCFVGYSCALAYHGFLTNIAYTVALSIITVVGGLLVGIFSSKGLREYRFRHVWAQAIAKLITEFLGVYGCFFLLSRIRKHTRGVCWIYASLSGFSLCLFRIVCPSFDFSIPNMLAQVAMNESLHNDNKAPGLTAGVGLVCFLIIIAQGMVNVNLVWCPAEEEDIVDEEDGAWTLLPIFFAYRDQMPALRFRRLSWAFLSLFACGTYTVSFAYFPHNNHDEYPYLFPLIFMFVMFLVQLGLAKYNILPEIRFENQNAKMFAKILFDSGGVYGCFFILANLKKHTHSVCFMFFSLALYSLAFFKVISPSFDFSIPSLLAQIALNESLHDANKGDTGFKIGVAFLCFGIFLIQTILDFGWEPLRGIFATSINWVRGLCGCNNDINPANQVNNDVNAANQVDNDGNAGGGGNNDGNAGGGGNNDGNAGGGGNNDGNAGGGGNNDGNVGGGGNNDGNAGGGGNNDGNAGGGGNFAAFINFVRGVCGCNNDVNAGDIVNDDVNAASGGNEGDMEMIAV